MADEDDSGVKSRTGKWIMGGAASGKDPLAQQIQKLEVMKDADPERFASMGGEAKLAELRKKLAESKSGA